TNAANAITTATIGTGVNVLARPSDQLNAARTNSTPTPAPTPKRRLANHPASTYHRAFSTAIDNSGPHRVPSTRIGTDIHHSCHGPGKKVGVSIQVLDM